MTQEIIEMAQKCGLVGMRPHLDGIYIESLLAFAKLVADKALAEHAMQEVQRLGQEIEQEPVRLQCVICGTVYADGVPPQVTQPEQEPVAWIERDIQCDDFDPDSVRFEKPRIAASSGREWVPLYTSSPKETT
jgi:hypothetical protein